MKPSRSKSTPLAPEVQEAESETCIRDTDHEFLEQQIGVGYGRKIKGYARQYKLTLLERADLKKYDPQRMKDVRDFDYRFQHAHRFKEWLSERLKIIAAKLMWKKKDGSPGYFAKMEQDGLEWKSHASIISSIEDDWADAHIRCGIWTQGNSKKRNSGRCHQHDLCSLCIWIDHLRLLMEAFDPDSGAFVRGQNWFIMHLSVRDSEQNSFSIGRALKKDDFDLLNPDGMYSELYEPRPVPLEADLDTEDLGGINTCRYVFVAVQEALDALYQQKIICGFRQKLEVALSLAPTKGLPHGHAVANGQEDDPRFIADEIYAEMARVLNQYRHELCVPLYPSVRVFAIPSADALILCLKYLEKPIPLNILVTQALECEEAKNPDSLWNNDFLLMLENDLLNLHEQLGYLGGGFRGFGFDFHRLQRRRSRGNMRCGKRFIGLEPEWHKEKRERQAKEQADRRAEKARMLREEEGQTRTMIIEDADDLDTESF